MSLSTSLSDVTVTLPNGAEVNAYEHVLISGDDAPSCVFGDSVDDWAPFAVAWFDLLVASGADNSEHLLDESISKIVNASSVDEVAGHLQNSVLGQRLVACIA